MTGWQTIGEAPERLAHRSLHLVAIHGTTDLAANGDAEPDVITSVVRLTRERVEHKVTVRLRTPVAVGAIEVAAARESTPFSPLAAFATRLANVSQP